MASSSSSNFPHKNYHHSVFSPTGSFPPEMTPPTPPYFLRDTDHAKHQLFHYQSELIKFHGPDIAFLSLPVHPTYPFLHLSKITQFSKIPQDLLNFLWYYTNLFFADIEFDLMFLINLLQLIEIPEEYAGHYQFLRWFLPRQKWLQILGPAQQQFLRNRDNDRFTSHIILTLRLPHMVPPGSSPVAVYQTRKQSLYYNASSEWPAYRQWQKYTCLQNHCIPDEIWPPGRDIGSEEDDVRFDFYPSSYLLKIQKEEQFFKDHVYSPFDEDLEIPAKRAKSDGEDYLYDSDSSEDDYMNLSPSHTLRRSSQPPNSP